MSKLSSKPFHFPSFAAVLLGAGGLALACLGAPLASGDAGTDGSAWRVFRDKEGHEVEARIQSLSPDCRTVRISRRDGKLIDLVVTRLSLDDQQHLREWFFARPPADPATLRFRITAERRDRPKSREKLSNTIHEALWETSELSYGLSVTNLSNGPVPNLKLEYCLLLEDMIDILPKGDGTDSDVEEDEAAPLWRANRAGEVRYVRGTIDLPLLTFNRPHTLETDALIRVLIRTARLTREESEDRPVGLMLRLVNSAGQVVASHQDMTREHAGMDWDTLIARRDPAEKNGAGSLVEAVASN